MIVLNLRRSLSVAMLGFSALTWAADEKILEIKSEAPDFSLKDMNGKNHSLKQYRGKTVVLEWVNFDCPYVKKHYGSKNMPTLQEKYKKAGVVWLSIASSKPGKQGNFPKSELLARMKLEGAVPTAYLIDDTSAVAEKYHAKVTPHMFIINKKGRLAYAGGIDDLKSTDQADVAKATPLVANALDELVAGKEVASVDTSAAYGCGIKF